MAKNKNRNGNQQQTASVDPEASPILDEPNVALVESTKPKENIPATSDPAYFEGLWEKYTSTGSAAMNGSGSAIPNRTVEFPLDGTVSPAFIDEAGNIQDVMIIMRSLTSGEEMKATRGCMDPIAMTSLLTKASIRSASGQILNDTKREFFWELIGPGGRQICLTMFSEIGTATPDAVGKAQAGHTTS